ncbi:pyruvate dehydrogenase (acetyl-transferring), homodimeric type [Schlesneria sp.]|uniref:pyruvate dehydrogenase (acetyl-transferring), homodimeric type n=1 Tax=Schlesneria sp. TaxID=2762018 RepID=UPI002EEF0A58
MASTLQAAPAVRRTESPQAADVANPTDEVSDVTVPAIDPQEMDEWLESVDDLLHRYGPEALSQLLTQLYSRAQAQNVPVVPALTTPYVNTIPPEAEHPFPGDRDIERRLRSIIRWNAMAMVVRGNQNGSGVGGHISTFASSAVLVEVGFNHFFHAPTADHTGDMVYFQGHSSPGMYARAFVEGRLTEENLNNFRRELPRGQGLSSYPHPWLMPDFWQFPTVSMGLGPICSIYHARFLRYVQHRNLLETSKSRVWSFIGDGEIDEPETLGAISMASREKLDNLTWVVNCNLQRLDGPVRSNGKIIQELEGIFRGAGWNVIKIVWGSEWDALFEADEKGLLAKALAEVVDGQFQKYSVESGEFIRKDFFGRHPELLKLVENLTDEQIRNMRRGGHDALKVYNGLRAAVEFKGAPTVVLAHTIKGFGLGSEAEGKNTAHNTKGLAEASLLAMRDRFELPFTDEQAKSAIFYRPPADSPEMKYLHDHRKKLGGYLPARTPTKDRLAIPDVATFVETMSDAGKDRSTTGVLGTILRVLMRDKNIGKRIVPIIPDEARTFGMEGLFQTYGIYSSKGQLYTPVDAGSAMSYKESTTGQVLMEGINEAGAMASFVAAGTAYANIGLNMVPFYTYYSMFGFQRVGDLIWLAADSRCKGFLCGGTSGRTTLNGEGLQHEDGHSQLIASTVPNLLAYDPAYGYELAVIVQDGLRRMYAEGEDILYYLSVYNESYQMPDAMPKGVETGIVKGLYPLDPAVPAKKRATRPQLLGSGPILRDVIRAQKILAENYGVEADVWSVTSYNELKRDAQAAARWNRLHPDQKPKASYLEQTLAGLKGPFISSSDNVQLVAEQIRPYMPGQYIVLGTDGFGRSDTRVTLRRHFEIDAECVVYTTLVALSREGQFDAKKLPQVLKDLGVYPDKIDPAIA